MSDDMMDEMEKSICCLGLEVEYPIFMDVRERWSRLKDHINAERERARAECERLQRSVEGWEADCRREVKNNADKADRIRRLEEAAVAIIERYRIHECAFQPCKVCKLIAAFDAARGLKP